MNWYRISCYRKKDESQETDFKDAVEVCLPLINAAIRDAEKETFPKNCFLNIEIPRSPLSNKVCKFCYIINFFFPTCFTALCKIWYISFIYCTKSAILGRLAN